MKSTLKKFPLIFIVLMTFSAFAFGQTTDREKAIAFYNQERYRDAARIFKQISKTNKKDAEIWNYLGLAYFKDGNYKKAEKAFKRAIKLNPKNFLYKVNTAYVYLFTNREDKLQKEIAKAIELNPKHPAAYFLRGTMYFWNGEYDKAITDADKIISLDKKYSNAYLLKVNALLRNFGEKWRASNEPDIYLSLLQKAAETLNSCKDDCREDKTSKTFEQKEELVKGFYDYLISRNENKSDLNNTDTTKNTPLKVLFRPNPSYTMAARQANYQGKVTLAILFPADGKTVHVVALNRLDYGLTEKAIEAANLIEFEPEMEDGKPISVVKRLQYSFTIY